MQVYPGTIVNMLTYVAQQEGIFKKHNINASLVPINSSPGGAAALAGNSIDILSGSPDAVLPFIEKGLSVQLFAGQTKQIFQVIVNNSVKSSGSYPESIKALDGKNIGVTALGSAGQALMEAMLSDAGLPSTAVHFVAVGGPATGLAAVLNDQVAADLLYDPTPTAAVASGKAHILVDLRKPGQGPSALSGADYVGEWAKDSYIKAHPDVIKNLRAAFEEADTWMHDPSHLSAVTGIYKSVVGQAIQPQYLNKFVHDNLSIATANYSKKSLDAWNAFDAKYGILSSPVDISKIYLSGTPTE